MEEQIQQPSPSEGFSKKERRELRRQERQAGFWAQDRKRKFGRLGKWGFIVLVIGALLWLGWSYIRQQTPTSAPGEFIPELSRDHISVGEPHIDYNSNPPTSGPHYADPEKCGIFTEELIDEKVIHTLEHGAVWVTYRPGIQQDRIKELESLARKYSKVVLSPRSKNDSDIAVVSWSRLLKVSSNDFSAQLIEDFIKSWRNRAPENVSC